VTGTSVLVTCSVFEPGFRGGGPIKSVAHIIDSTPDDVDVFLVTGDRDLGSAAPYPDLSGRWVRRGRCNVFYLDRRNPLHWLRLLRRLRRKKFDLLYLNSLWSPTYSILPMVAVRLRLLAAERTLIAPRGEFSPGALSLKGRKKRLFLRAWQPMLQTATVAWHASTDREADEIRARVPAMAVEVNADQTELPQVAMPPREGTVHELRLVFVGRIARKKNLDLVLRALALVTKPVTLHVYGPIEDARYWRECDELIGALPGHIGVRYAGELLPPLVRRTFSRYDAFVFPTLGENFGHVIAESLSAACPVVCSDRTPWTPVLRTGGGIVLEDLTPRHLADEVERLAAADGDERRHLRLQCADAYSRWRDNAVDRNILEQVRESTWWNRSARRASPELTA
jgi:glycosyltransferase involved in cell wall biosynthesis